jgi:hypothetical protein
MLKVLLDLLRTTPYRSAEIDRARGKYKYPETIKEAKRYLKFRING